MASKNYEELLDDDVFTKLVGIILLKMAKLDPDGMAAVIVETIEEEIEKLKLDKDFFRSQRLSKKDGFNIKYTFDSK